VDNGETTLDETCLAFPRTSGAKNASRQTTCDHCTPDFAIFIPRVCPFLHNSSDVFSQDQRRATLFGMNVSGMARAIWRGASQAVQWLGLRLRVLRAVGHGRAFEGLGLGQRFRGCIGFAQGRTVQQEDSSAMGRSMSRLEGHGLLPRGHPTPPD